MVNLFEGVFVLTGKRCLFLSSLANYLISTRRLKVNWPFFAWDALDCLVIVLHSEQERIIHNALACKELRICCQYVVDALDLVLGEFKQIVLDIAVYLLQVHVFQQVLLVDICPPKPLLFLPKFHVSPDFASFKVKCCTWVFQLLHLQGVLHHNYCHWVKDIRFYLVQTVDSGK